MRRPRDVAATVAALALALSFPLACAPPEAASRAAARPLVPVAPDSYADLAPLGRAIGEARVVALGEPLHATGNIDAYGAHVVAYLHERLGFTVLAWEAGLWSCEDDPAHCLGWPWGMTSATRELRSLPAPSGMRVTGFDVHFTGPDYGVSVKRLRAALVAALGPTDPALAGCVAKALEDIPKGGKFHPMTASARTESGDVLKQALRALEASPASPDRDLLVRAVQNVLSLYAWHEAVHADLGTEMDWGHHASLNNVRDRAMAENVLWLLGTRYRGQRIILWTANMHAARNVEALTDLRGPEWAGALSGYKTMGTWLREALGPGYYALAATAYEGQVGLAPLIPIAIIEPALPGSLEADFLPTHGATRFVALGQEAASPRRGRFLGLSDFDAPWSHVFDGAFVFREVTPAPPEASTDPGAPSPSR